MVQPELERLLAVLSRLRRECPWDAGQTHASLVGYLVEETCETVEAIETGNDTDLREELGDLLLQVVFHAEIAGERPGGFGLEDIARGIADKLVSRHPYVFPPAGGSGAPDEVPSDLDHSWEQRKAVEKGRTSVLQGIPEQLSALARAEKIIGRARSRRVAIELPDEKATAEEIGDQLLTLVARAQASGVDAEQAARAAVRRLETEVRAAESDPGA